MRQHHFMRPNAMAAAMAALTTLSAWSQAPDGSVTYRCPNNDYKNTISAQEAEKLGCRKLEGAPVTVIQTVKPRPSLTGPPSAASGDATARIDPSAQRVRDSDARRILESELRSEEERLATLKREFNGGQPERQGNEQNYQKYVDRVAQLSAAIARKEGDISAIRRELQKLPPGPPPPVL